jgi:hypothetical protein
MRLLIGVLGGILVLWFAAATVASANPSAGPIIVTRLDIESSVAPTAATAILVVATEFGGTPPASLSRSPNGDARTARRLESAPLIKPHRCG